MLLDLFLLFLRDGFAQVIGFRRGIACQFHGSPHDLFLVDRDAIGITEDRFHGRMPVDHFRLAVHAADVVGNEIQRSRTEERHHGDDVVQRLGLHLHQPLGHARAFQLENTQGVPLAKEGVDLRVIGRNVAQVVLNAMALPDQLAGPRHDGQRGQSEEINLEHFEFFENAHFVLRDGFDGCLIRIAGGTVQWQVFDQRSVRDDHSGGMGPGIAYHAFHPGSRVDQLMQVIRGFIFLFQLRKAFESLGDDVAQRYGLGGNVGDDLGHPVHFGERDIHHASDVT